MNDKTLRSYEIEFPRGYADCMPEGTWEHLRVVTNRTARKFNLSDDDKEELHARLLAKVLGTEGRNFDHGRARWETYLNAVIENELTDWKKEQFATRTKAEEWRDRRILYSPTRYGTVGKMVRTVDFNLALAELDDDELKLLDLHVYGNTPVKEAGRRIGLSKRGTLSAWESVQRKFAKYYRRGLRRDRNSSGRVHTGARAAWPAANQTEKEN